MSIHSKIYFAIIIIIFTILSPIYSAQSKKNKLYAHGQQKLYDNHDLKTTIRNNFLAAQNAYKKADYQLASILAKGALSYGNIMNISPLNETEIISAHYIISDCHLNYLNSPQHALKSFKYICDKQTSYGTISSQTISKCLLNKTQKIQKKNQKLSEKLIRHSHKYAITFYAKTYKNKTLDEIIDAFKSTVPIPEKQEVLIDILTQNAAQNDMRCQAVLAIAYHSGNYGVTQNIQRALQYATRYIISLVSTDNSISLPLERFGVKQLLYSFAPLSYLYYRYCDAIFNDNKEEQHKVLDELEQYTDISIHLRNFVLQILTQKQLCVQDFFTIENLSNFEDIMSAFIISDGLYIIPILEKALQNKHPQSGIIHHILGLLYYYKSNYSNAYNHLTKSGAYLSDVSTQYKVLQSFTKSHNNKSKKDAYEAIEIIKKVLMQKKQTSRNNKAYTEGLTLFSQHIIEYSRLLLKNNDYKLVIALSNLCLQNSRTYPIGIKVLYLINNAISSVEISTMLLQSKAFAAIKQHYNKENDELSFACISNILTRSMLHNNKQYNNNYHEYANFMSYSLEHEHYNTQERLILEKTCGGLYYLASQNTTSDLRNEHLYNAVRYNNPYALVELCSVVFDTKDKISIHYTKNINTMLEAMYLLCSLEDLAENEGISTDIRVKALNFLIKLQYSLRCDSHNNPQRHDLTEQEMATYLQREYELGSTKHIRSLATCYALGVYNTHLEEWIIKPNEQKVTKLMDFSLKINPTTTNKSFTAEAYYECGEKYHSKAFELFKTIVKQEENNQKLSLCAAFSLLHMSVITLHSDLNEHTISKSYNYLPPTIKPEAFAELISNELYEKLYFYAQDLIRQHNVEPYAIKLYTLLAITFFGKKEKTPSFMIDPDLINRGLALAAENDVPLALILAILNVDPLFNRWQKIEYVYRLIPYHEFTCGHTATEQIVSILDKCFPSTMHEKCDLIDYLYLHCNKFFVLEYLYSDNFGKIPQKNSPFFTTSDNELAQKFKNNTILTKNLGKFDKIYGLFDEQIKKNMGLLSGEIRRTIGITPYIMHVATNYAYALMQSNDQKDILKSASYANKLLECIDSDRKTLTHIIIQCYLKLAHAPGTPPVLAKAYLDKSIALGFQKKEIKKIKLKKTKK